MKPQADPSIARLNPPHAHCPGSKTRAFIPGAPHVATQRSLVDTARTSWLVAFCALAAGVRAAAPVNGIEILSMHYQLSGSVDYYDQDGNYLSTWSYSEASDTHPLVVNYNHGTPGIVAAVNTFSLHNEAWVGFEVSYASASGDWQFRPQGSILDLGLRYQYFYNYYPWEQGLSVNLKDMTSGAQLLDIDYDVAYSDSTQYQFHVNPSDVYDFSISGWTSNFSFKDVTEDVRATFLSPSAVPEQLSCGWLLGLTLGGLLAGRWKLNAGKLGPFPISCKRLGHIRRLFVYP